MKECPFCRGPIEEKRVEHVHRWKGNLYILRNVPGRSLYSVWRSVLQPFSAQGDGPNRPPEAQARRACFGIGFLALEAVA